MLARSDKQPRYFQFERMIKKGDVSPNDYIKIREIVQRLREEESSAEYSISKMREVEGKTFDQLLNENTGVRFNKQELLAFQSKQKGFGGFGKVNFTHKQDRNEIAAEISSNESNKTYVFKKLANNESKGMFNYACFIEVRGATEEKSKPKIVYTLSTIFSNNDDQNTKVLTDFINRINNYGL